MTRRTHINTALALAAGALLALPASGMAADSFGSRLLNEPGQLGRVRHRRRARSCPTSTPATPTATPTPAARRWTA